MKEMERLYGIHSVREAIRAERRPIRCVWQAPGNPSGRLTEIAAMAAARNIPVHTAANERLAELAQQVRHQGVVAEAGPFPAETDCLGPLNDLRTGPGFFLAADSITDPRNLGALIRTALAVGVDAVIIPRDRCAPPTPAVSRASAGALEHIRLVQVTNLVRALNDLKTKGMWIFGLDHLAPTPCFASDFTGPLALVVGGEEKGIRPLVKNTCDHLVSIPQHGAVASLNASVAGAVVMYEVLRQRRLT